MNTKYYTTIEQSKKLLELGLDDSSADMCWIDRPSRVADCPEVPVIMNIELESMIPQNKLIPCWSVGALMSVMDSEVGVNLVYERKQFFVIYRGRHYQGSTRYSYNSPIDALFEMICYLLENKYI